MTIEEEKQKLADIEARLQKAQKAEPETMNTGSEKYKNLSLAWRMVIELVSGVLIGACMGWGIDELFDLSPWFTIVFGALGFVAGIKTMIKTAQTASKV